MQIRRLLLIAALAAATLGFSVPAFGATTVYVTGDLGDPGGAMALTSAQLAGTKAPVLLAGDIAYETGSQADYAANFTPYFGSFIERMWPVPGNHDYGSGFPYYFSYWGSRVGSIEQSWYAKTIGSWRVLMLDSNCEFIGGCTKGSPEYRWASAQLKSFLGQCVAAVWHHPRWSTGPHGNNDAVTDLYALLVRRHVDLLLTGHDHDYQRFYRSDADGVRDRQGVREFVVGTGGAALYDFTSDSPLIAKRSSASYGSLKLTLRSRGYRWEFMPTSGTFSDSGHAKCLSK